MQIPRTLESGLRTFLIAALPAFFVVGGLGNLFPSQAILADYARWGYPAWFHYITGAAELLTAALLCARSTYLLGTLLGGLLMAAAFVTLIVHAETGHAVAPAIVGLALAIRLWLDGRIRRARWEGRLV